MTRRLMPSWLRPWTLLVLVVLLVGGACGDDDSKSASAGDDSTRVSTPADRTLSGGITVLAAASLTEAFSEIGDAFETANPRAEVTFSFAGSSALALQANNGAPADVFAAADDVNMKKVTDAGNASNPKTFTRNRLAILVQKHNPLGIATLADLGRSEVIYVICKDGVPCGNYSRQALDRAGVTRSPASLEGDVKGVVTKVTTKQADAGLVYVTDAKAAAAATERIAIPDEHNVAASYPIAVLRQSSKVELAGAFIDFVLSAAGQTILAKYGFLSAS
jgi:molybdate transport system substrate-binding protein